MRYEKRNYSIEGYYVVFQRYAYSYPLSEGLLVTLNGEGKVVGFNGNKFCILKDFKGNYSEEDLVDIHSHMIVEIEKAGGRIDGIYFCTSLTDEDIRRKPGRGMLDDILRDHPDVDLSKTIMIGDGDVDRDFAKNCGISFQRIDSLKRDGESKYWVNTCETLI